MAAYLETAMVEAPDDPAYITAVLNETAGARGIMKLASDPGMTRAGLCKALATGSELSFETVGKDQQGAGVAVVAEVGRLTRKW